MQVDIIDDGMGPITFLAFGECACFGLVGIRCVAIYTVRSGGRACRLVDYNGNLLPNRLVSERASENPSACATRELIASLLAPGVLSGDSFVAVGVIRCISYR